jgi:L-seryl-tRNA(Ser) seleniumtransferase
MSNPVFRGWPSVTDLLESPPLRALAARVQPQQLAADVGRFLQKVRSDLHNATAEAPAPADLATRVATWIAAQNTPGNPAVINATGALFPDALGGTPLADSVATRFTAAVRNPLTRDARGDRAAALAAKRAGAEAATLFTHVAGGITTALAALAHSGSALVARGQVLDIDDVPLTEIARCAHVPLVELGVANRATAAQFDAAAAPNRASGLASGLASGRASAALASHEPKLILGITPTAFRWRPPFDFPTWEALADVARRHQVPLLIDLGLAGLTPVDSPGLEGLTAATAALRAGADLCFVRGDKLLGGPPCGIALGNARLIEQLDAHPLRNAWRLSSAYRVALEATLEVPLNTEATASGDFDSESPSVRLLRASTDNLRNRAERLAPQLAAIPGIAAADARVSQGSLVSAHDGWSIPSWSVFLQPNTGHFPDFIQRLGGATPAVAARHAGDWVEFNLRSVFPSQDTDLVAAVTQIATA